MRRFTIIAAALIVMSGSVAAQKRFVHQASDGIKVKPSAEVQTTKDQANKVRKAPGELFMPQHEEVYFYETVKWVNTGYTDYTYDSNGNVLTSTYVTDDGSTRTEYEYDEQNRWVVTTTYSYDTTGKLLVTPGSTTKRTRVFDTVVKDLVVESMEYDIKVAADSTVSWTLVDRGRTWKRNVARDDKGRVTGVTVSAYWGNAFEETRRTTVTYNEDGLAETWKYEELAFSGSKGYYWDEFYTLVDMRWQLTDGQIVMEDLGAFYTGNNRLKSATLEEPGYDGGWISAAYSEDGNYSYTFKYNSEPLGWDVRTYTYTDENGSMTEESHYYVDADGDGNYSDEELMESSKTVVTCDENKEIVAEEFYEDDELVGGAKYDFVYADYAYPTEWSMSEYDYDTQTYVPYIKLVRSDFVDVMTLTAIDGVATVRDGGVQGVYNLQGVRVASQMDGLPAGLYIVKKDGKTLKVVRK